MPVNAMPLYNRNESTYVDSVIERTVLSNGDEHRLVVRGGVDRRNLVSTRGETTANLSGEDAVLRLGVETLEEVELRRVRRRRARERVDRLDDDVRVAVDHAVRREVLRGGEVVRVRVHEEARDRKSTRLNSSHSGEARMPSSA